MWLDCVFMSFLRGNTTSCLIGSVGIYIWWVFFFFFFFFRVEWRGGWTEGEGDARRNGKHEGGGGGFFFFFFFVCVGSGRRCTEWKENAAENENHEEEEVLYLRCSWPPLFTDRGKQALLAICMAWPYFTDRRVCVLWRTLCSSCGSYSVFKTRTTALFLSWGSQTRTPWPP